MVTLLTVEIDKIGKINRYWNFDDNTIQISQTF